MIIPAIPEKTSGKENKKSSFFMDTAFISLFKRGKTFFSRK
ncbi:MAG: hypothetical protein SCAL_000918 [Candidatus Syntrophoarchaeum caldarius]|uniref:Uncharacterized protein n=1 Tax=Candidatus Syntropharchaeum caldarium TaxID=1838285 RepID=A0A1F2PAL9_9EURY|nr:MAG: hypothetical protein SCAL_000918 [Candidatus Syntrophoarchaeum caldarius]